MLITGPPISHDPGHPEIIFERLVHFWRSKTSSRNRRQITYPLQTMLLILCPDILSSVVVALKASGSSGGNELFVALPPLP